jgi:hypothetical protein
MGVYGKRGGWGGRKEMIEFAHVGRCDITSLHGTVGEAGEFGGAAAPPFLENG